MQTPTGQNSSDNHQSNTNNSNQSGGGAPGNNSGGGGGNNNNNNHHTNTSHQTSNSVQMQYQNNPSYSPQIISVNPNSLMNNYQSNMSTPTSPQDNSLVQSVYSQGPTPSQSPTQMGSGSGSGNIGGGGGGGSSSQCGAQSMPPKRKRSVNPQGDENFIRALEAVRCGGIGFCKAARLFGVNNRTLWLEYKKRGYPISRPSIKNRIKLEPNMTPPPSTTPTNEENTMESYDHLTPTAINMATIPPSESSSAPLMCPPHAHSMGGVMGFLDTRHVEFSSSIHSVSRQRYPDPTVSAAAMNLQGLNFNSM